MFYLYKGSVCVTLVGKTIPQYKELKAWCKKCGKQLKTKREYIEQDDTCDNCYKK